MENNTWVEKASLGLDMDHGLLVCNLCVACVAKEVKTSGVRTTSLRDCPRFWSVCSLQVCKHTLPVPSSGLRSSFLCNKEALWFGLFCNPSHYCCASPKPCHLSAPSAALALACLLQFITCQWSQSLFSLFN